MKSVIWQIFTKSKEGPFARCNICKNDYKTSGNTSNLLDHCKRKHKLQFDRLQKQKDAEVNNEANAEDCDDPVAGSNTAVKRRNVTIKNYITKKYVPYDKNSDRKIKLDLLLIEYVAHDFEPFRIVERDCFKQFVHELDNKYELPSRTHLKEVLLPQLYNQRKATLVKILSTVDHISITTDMWTSTANDGILTITSHFIYDNDIKSAVLETRKVVGHYFSSEREREHIAEELDEILREWNIREKIVTIVSDNASNMIKTAAVLRIRHSPCFAHTINLVALDALEIESVKLVLKHVKEIVTYFRSSTLAMDKLRDMQKQLHKEELKLLQDTPTRWNSSFYMAQRILKLRDPLLLAMSELRKSPPPLMAEDISILEDLILILSPLEIATKNISGTQYVTMSLIIPLIHGISSRLNSIKNSIKTNIGKEVFEKLSTSVVTRLYPYESRTVNIMATVLDPRYKMLAFRNNNQSENANQLFINILTAEFNSVQSADENKENDSGTSSFQNLEKENDLLSFLDNRKKITYKKTSSTADAIICARQYLESKTCERLDSVFQFWKNYPSNILRSLAYKFLSSPGSSVPSERVFSNAGLILTDRRNRLKPAKLNFLLFIRQNSWLKSY